MTDHDLNFFTEMTSDGLDAHCEFDGCDKILRFAPGATVEAVEREMEEHQKLHQITEKS